MKKEIFDTFAAKAEINIRPVEVKPYYKWIGGTTYRLEKLKNNPAGIKLLSVRQYENNYSLDIHYREEGKSLSMYCDTEEQAYDAAFQKIFPTLSLPIKENLNMDKDKKSEPTQKIQTKPVSSVGVPKQNKTIAIEDIKKQTIRKKAKTSNYARKMLKVFLNQTKKILNRLTQNARLCK